MVAGTAERLHFLLICLIVEKQGGGPGATSPPGEKSLENLAQCCPQDLIQPEASPPSSVCVHSPSKSLYP